MFHGTQFGEHLFLIMGYQYIGKKQRTGSKLLASKTSPQILPTVQLKCKTDWELGQSLTNKYGFFSILKGL